MVGPSESNVSEDSVRDEDAQADSASDGAQERLRQHLRARLGEEQAAEIVAEMTGQRSEDTEAEEDDAPRRPRADGNDGFERR